MSPTAPLPKRLITLTAYLALVLTIALPLGHLTLTHTTTPAPTHPTTSSPAPTSPTTPDSPRTTKADRAAAAHDGCRQTPSSDNTLLARPSCRSGMPITRDHMTQAPDTSLPGQPTSPRPITPNEVPPAWADHWGAAAHSPHHRSQA